jgi:hypothetical protein
MYCDVLESREFEPLISKAKQANDLTVSRHRPHALREDTALVLSLMHIVHDTLKQEQTGTEPEPLLPRSSISHLHDPRGACASYTQVLAKCLSDAGFSVRKLGLYRNGSPAVHHLLEAKVDGEWAMLDAIHDLAVLSQGRVVSITELADNWDKLSSQVPADVTKKYDHRQFYYTNWQRIPGMRHFPGLIVWLESKQISLRLVLLNGWRWVMTLGLSLAVTAVALSYRSRSQACAKPSSPEAISSGSLDTA